MIICVCCFARDWGRILGVAFLLVVVGLPVGEVWAARSRVASSDAAKSNVSNERLLKVCAGDGYKFTPEVREAFLVYAKAQAMSELRQQRKYLPDEFLSWVDSDEEIRASVYGTRLKASDVLLMLYSLRLDLGRADFEKYRQLAMAAAVVHSKLASEADINPRRPIRLSIGGDPRRLVDTRARGRKLDMNDHIINFLNDNMIEVDVVTYKLPELKYDDRGIAIPAPKDKKGKVKKVKVTEKQTRSLYAADVLASKELQGKFNAYMKSKGHDVNIDCGERLIHWKSRDMIRGEQNKKIDAAYKMFKTAYEVKGLLPEKRDPFPTPGELCAYIIRNDKYKFPADLQAQRKWPRFPLTAAWPVTTMLVANNQPLRERQERWQAFCDTGEFRTYGEYIGSVAQQYNMQSARRIKPHAFTYGSVQMMLKDGGVCGTMANISVRSHVSLGVPASTAGQPGHCALVTYRYDPKSKTYACKGGQYATGGDDKTGVHVPWFFGDVDARRKMIYHQSIAWAMNYGVNSYLDSNIAYAVFRQLPESEQKNGGMKLLESGLEINPYNFLLADAALVAADTADEQIRFWKHLKGELTAAKAKAGCPPEGLYNTTIKNKMFANIAKLPMPEDRNAVREILAFLQEEKCEVPEAIIACKLALQGLPKVLLEVKADYKTHLRAMQVKASRDNDTASAKMAATIKAAGNCIKDKNKKKQWALSLLRLTKGRQKYFGHKYRVSTDASVSLIAKLSGQKILPETELIKPLLGQVTTELRKSVAGVRNIKDCKVLSARITGCGNAIKDQGLKRGWLEKLSKLMAGRETFKPVGGKAKPLRDPCADTIKKALEAVKA